MKNNERAKEMCEDCGKVFMATKNEFFCPACRKRRLSDAAKKRNLSEIGHKSRKKNKEETK